jgi:hypothetical protein
VVFVAVNMDGEKANERMLAKVYTDKALIELSTHTLNLIASAAEHTSADKPCPKFEGLYCLDHRRIDTTLRKELLKPDSEGYVVAPQHVFLDPQGKVLLSVPYEVSTSELAWCFVAALHQVDPALAVAAPAGARPPKRLIQGAVFDPAAAPGGGARMLTKKEVLDLIAELKKSGRANWELERLRGLIASDEPQAREFIALELKSGGGRGAGGGGGGGGRGGGGGGGRGGGGAAAGAGGGDGERRHARIVHLIGTISPPSWWEVLVDPLAGPDVELRAEAAVALEQLGSPEALKELQAALQDEKETSVEKDMLRALGTVGAQDPHARALLMRRLHSEKDELLRLNSIVATGSLAPGDDTTAELEKLLTTGSASEKQAAACAMAMSRDARYEKALESAAQDTKDAAAALVAKTALGVVHGAELKTIRDALKSVCKDTIERERFFGKAKD